MNDITEPTPAPLTIQQRLENIARAINNRYGEFPDADTIREAIAHIDTLEAAAKPATTPAPDPKGKA